MDICLLVGLRSVGVHDELQRTYGMSPTAYRAAHARRSYARFPTCVLQAYARPRTARFEKTASSGAANVGDDRSFPRRSPCSSSSRTRRSGSDKDEALAFYTEKLGMELREDVTVPELGNFRWLTSASRASPTSPSRSWPFRGRRSSTRTRARQIQALLAKGAASGLFFSSDDVQGSYEELKRRGVEFTQEPTQQPYGLDAGFRDSSGNHFRMMSTDWPEASGPLRDRLDDPSASRVRRQRLLDSAIRTSSSVGRGSLARDPSPR